MDETDGSDGRDAPRESQPDPGIDRRLNAERIVRWVFLDGHRGVISGVLLAGVFGVSLLLIRVGLVTPAEAGDVTQLAGALIGGMLPFITVVLAINQLILSAEFGTTGSFRERLEETRQYRREIEDHTGTSPSPAEPSAFLRALVRTKREVTVGLRDACPTDASAALREELEGFVASTTPRDADAAGDLMEATFGTFAVVSTILDYNDPWQLQEVRRIRERFGDELTEDLDDRLTRLEDLLRDIHVARQYFKTVHMQQELADLSKILLYVGFPALVGGAFIVLAYGNLLALELHPYVYAVVVGTTVTALFSPFAVLFVYVLRIATVGRRTAADFGPFVLQQRIPDESADG